MKNIHYYILAVIIIVSAIIKFIFANDLLIHFSLGSVFLYLSILSGILIVSLKKEIYPYISLLFRIGVGGFFVFAAIGKIADPTQFSKEIANYQMLPNIVINAFALILPWIELFAGIMFIIGAKIKSSGIVISILLLMFIFAISTAYARDLNINCGCTAQLGAELIGWGKIFEDLLMLGGAFFVIFSATKNILSVDDNL